MLQKAGTSALGVGEGVLMRVDDLSMEYNVGDWSQLQDLADSERES